MQLLKIPMCGDPPPPFLWRFRLRRRRKPPLKTGSIKRNRLYRSTRIQKYLLHIASPLLSFLNILDFQSHRVRTIPRTGQPTSPCSSDFCLKVFLVFDRREVLMEDEELLRGELLRLICAALHRNGIRSLKSCAIVDVPDEFTVLKKPPKSAQQPNQKWMKKGV